MEVHMHMPARRVFARPTTIRADKRTGCFIGTAKRRVVTDGLAVDVESVTLWTEQRREPRCLTTVT